MNLGPVTLRGQLIRLEPLSVEHVPALVRAGLHDELWRWTTTKITSEDEMWSYAETALAWHAANTALPFVTIAQSTNEVIGSTRFANVDHENRRMEIGWTWVTPAWQRTGANVEAKLLMLRHAFDVLSAVRVEFKTDSLNEKSRNALLGIGATEEGLLRNHMIVWDGRLRHSAYYSILPAEWPAVQARLEERLARSRAIQ